MKENLIPISLYIHTPWCLHKCPYCDFNSHAHQGPLPEDAYIERLIEDFKQQFNHLQNRKLKTIFIGGGTPSLLNPKSYERLFAGLKEITDLSEVNEITLEANPGTFEIERFEGFRKAGINRLSIGVQSFQNEKLKQLQRIHNADETIHAIQCAQQVGFDNFNIDLMFGLPNQTIEDGLYDLQTALDLNPTHLSWYQLTLEPHTYFHAHPPTLPDDEMIWQLQEAGQQLLAQYGYQHYEVSAYAKSGRQCQHNRNYWLYGDYIGIGAGAHGKVTDFSSKEIIRYWNHKNPKDYLNTSKPTLNDSQVITTEERPLEFLMNALRLQESILISLFEERTGIDIQTIKPALDNAQRQNLLNWDSEKITLTQNGHRYLNELLTLF